MLRQVYGLQITLGLIFPLFVLFVAFENFDAGKSELAISRLILSIILSIYSLSQISLIIKSTLKFTNMASFAMIYIAFGVVWDIASIGYIKNWAPANTYDANMKNFSLIIVLLLLIFLAVYTTLKTSFSKKSHNK